MSDDIPAPFDRDNTDDLSEAEIEALIRAPKEVGDAEIIKNLCHFLMRHYFGG